MPKFQFINNTKDGVVVHLLGCKDIEKELKDIGNSELDIIQASSPELARATMCSILNINENAELWNASHIKIKPCCYNYLSVGSKVWVKVGTWQFEKGVVEQIQYEQGKEIYMVRLNNPDLFPDLISYRKEQLSPL